DGKGRRQREVLVDGLDAGGAGLHRRAEVHLRAVEEDLTMVGNHGAAQGLDERRLAGAIVADDAEDFPRHQVEGCMVEGGPAALPLDEAWREQDRLRRGGHADTFRIHWSSATATMIRRPTANSCQKLSKP